MVRYLHRRLNFQKADPEKAMHILLAALALVCVGFSSFDTIPPGASHRVLVLDIGRWPNKRPGSDQHSLLLLDIQPGKVLARTQLGVNTSLALSPQGDIIAALSGGQRKNLPGQWV
jgi:hypothetical protein